MTKKQSSHGPYYAHTGKTTDGTDWQLLAEHLKAVSKGAVARGRLVDWKNTSDFQPGFDGTLLKFATEFPETSNPKK